MKEWFTSAEISELTGQTERYILMRAEKENWDVKWQIGRGGANGRRKLFYVDSLSSDIQVALAKKCDVDELDLQRLCVEANLEALRKLSPISDCPSHPAKISEMRGLKGLTLNEAAISRDLVVQKALDPPAGVRKGVWLESVARKYQVHPQTIRKWIKKFREHGVAGLVHRKKNHGKPKGWRPPEGVNFWIGLVLKREHRKLTRKELYHRVLIPKAREEGWTIGSYSSACWWVKRRITPQLLALQQGGTRALDNVLPPILRDYSDLEPFEILVGDQHRFDFWVLDEKTGEVFRFECYLWQCLRTRLVYGAAAARRYNSQLMILALRIGMKRFGCFRGIYTDSGKPELSNLIKGVLSEVKYYFDFIEESDVPVDVSDIDSETINCGITDRGNHTKAVVRNAKAKMIEGTFAEIERILVNEFRVPGYVKRLSDSQEMQEVDQREVRRLVESGGLLTFREFLFDRFYPALDFYNSSRPHRGVLKEWGWRPRPKEATPSDCLLKCMEDGWRPTKLSDETIDHIFLAKAKQPRTVDRGRIRFRNELFEAEALNSLHGQKVSIRFDPFDSSSVLVFKDREFLCRAEPVEFSSMKNKSLAARKIEAKRRQGKESQEQYRAWTTGIADVRELSVISVEEKAPALMGRGVKGRLVENRELCEILPQTETEVHGVVIEEDRRPLFDDALKRYQWCLRELKEKRSLLAEDVAFCRKFERTLTPDELEYWERFKRFEGISGWEDQEESVEKRVH